MRHPSTRLATAFALTVVLLVPSVVLGHAELDTPTPADGAIVEGSPATIEATFTQDVDPATSLLQLRDAADTVVAEGRMVEGEPRRMAIDPVPELAPGDYEVRWTTFSAEDGEGPERGTWSFTVTAAPTPEPTAAPTPTPAASDSPTAEPTATATTPPTVAPSPSPSGDGGPAAEGGDVILPIVAALAIVAIAGAVLLTRRSRASGA